MLSVELRENLDFAVFLVSLSLSNGDGFQQGKPSLQGHPYLQNKSGFPRSSEFVITEKSKCLCRAVTRGSLQDTPLESGRVAGCRLHAALAVIEASLQAASVVTYTERAGDRVSIFR